MDLEEYIIKKDTNYFVIICVDDAEEEKFLEDAFNKLNQTYINCRIVSIEKNDYVPFVNAAIENIKNGEYLILFSNYDLININLHLIPEKAYFRGFFDTQLKISLNVSYTTELFSQEINNVEKKHYSSLMDNIVIETNTSANNWEIHLCDGENWERHGFLNNKKIDIPVEYKFNKNSFKKLKLPDNLIFVEYSVKSSFDRCKKIFEKFNPICYAYLKHKGKIYEEEISDKSHFITNFIDAFKYFIDADNLENCEINNIIQYSSVIRSNNCRFRDVADLTLTLAENWQHNKKYKLINDFTGGEYTKILMLLDTEINYKNIISIFNGLKMEFKNNPLLFNIGQINNFATGGGDIINKIYGIDYQLKIHDGDIKCDAQLLHFSKGEGELYKGVFSYYLVQHLQSINGDLDYIQELINLDLLNNNYNVLCNYYASYMDKYYLLDGKENGFWRIQSKRVVLNGGKFIKVNCKNDDDLDDDSDCDSLE